MELDVTKKRKRQSKITAIALLVTVAGHILAFVFLRVTGLDKIITDKVVEIVEAVAPPPAPPPPPPPPSATINAPPPVDMSVFEVTNVKMNANVNDGFDAGMLSNFGSGAGGVDLSVQAMDYSSNDMMNLVSNAQLAPMALSVNLGFDIGGSTNEIKKGKATGFGKRTTGKTAITTLDLSGDANNNNPWSDGELENITEFISKNTNVKAELGARSISFVDQYSNFNSWLGDAKKRVLSDDSKSLSETDPEIGALNALANRLPDIPNGNYERFKRNVKSTLTNFFNIRFGVKMNLEKDTAWGNLIDSLSSMTLADWQKNEYIPQAEKSFKELYNKKAPTGHELRGIYNYLRVSEIMRLPILLCEPRGIPNSLLPENRRFLRTYIYNGGFIYFINTVGLKNSRAIRGIITDLIGETIKDPVGDKTLAKLQKDDKEISGYVFREPTPQIFHPWTFFPMILPRQTDVYITIYNKIGNVVFTDTLKDKLPGAYLQKNRHYRWHAVDNQGNGVESGYYIYQVISDLHKQTMPMKVSKLRRLPNGKHKVFSSYFNISEVPTKETVKSEELPFGEKGVFGVSLRGRLCICYTEGYKEKALLGKSNKDAAAEEASLKWVTNVIIQMLQEGSLAR